MNEKFFDLKKEKQDRIINAALKVFALNGFQRASTDEIVKEASISKGLIFHYFTSKLGLYSFLYDYSTRFMTLEVTTNVPKDETDVFALLEKILEAQSDAMSQYPYIQAFIRRAYSENDSNALEQISDTRMRYFNMYSEIMRQADMSKFRDDVDYRMIGAMLEYTCEGILNERAQREKIVPEEYFNEIKKYLFLLKNIAYKEDM
ncbi:MAG: TetR/AcrR family transcriptional regulator [Butyrivibrio sp.]|nr:TetR/AcrR family transcriptional regulator [Butyrivibrio sp.]